MTTQIGPGQAAREPSESAASGATSVLQALRGLFPDPPREEPRSISPRLSLALLPARPGKTSRREATTGRIDVRALAAARGAEPSARPVARASLASQSPPIAPARPSSATAPAAGSRSASSLFLQVRAFLLGALCAGALTGSLIARAAAVSSVTNAPTADDAESPAREAAVTG